MQRLRITSVTIALLLLTAATLAGAKQTAPRSLELQDYYRLESADTPVISPDGRSVAFVRSYLIEAENRRQSEIWLTAVDGSSAPTRLTDPAFSATNPRWSPDSKLLAFVLRRRVPSIESESPIWFLRVDQAGSEAFQLRGVGGMPIFSPDNQWIAFTKPTPPGKREPRVYATEFEKKLNERFKGRTVDWMNYRADGRGYLPDPRDPMATPPEELYLVPRAGGTPKQITKLGVNVQAATWRPDSSALVLEANAQQRDEYLYESADLWIVTTEGQTKRLTEDGYDHSAATWSPDGRFVVFRRQQGLSQVIQAKQKHGGPVDLYRMPAAGGPMENLTATWDLLPGAPTASADGKFVYFSSGIGGNTHLFRVASTGGAVEQVTKGERTLGSISFAATTDRIAYSATDPTHPTEIFSARVDGAQEKKLSGVNDALVSEVQLSRAERMLYPSKDGTPIEGWLLLPRGYDPAKGKYPLLLNIHGGPHGAYGNNFSFQFQLLAANGYAVLYTNPRGSTNYGEKFLWGTWGGWGLLDSEDVMAGVDHALQKYAIDDKRLGVTGYSYGGFLTNWAITHTSRFAAAVAGAGGTNWISNYGTADMARTKETEFYGTPWEATSRELLLKLSPILYAGNVTTPTLFVHGEADIRVPIEQAEQMYLALKKRRVPAAFIRYPDSYHGGWTAWNTVHRYYQEMKWWEQYLQRKQSAAR